MGKKISVDIKDNQIIVKANFITGKATVNDMIESVENEYGKIIDYFFAIETSNEYKIKEMGEALIEMQNYHNKKLKDFEHKHIFNYVKKYIGYYPKKELLLAAIENIQNNS